jgi:hypothetical protein
MECGQNIFCNRSHSTAIERQILAALGPDKISIALKAFEELEEEEASLERQWKLRLERSHYEAQRAQRQYQAVEPLCGLPGYVA